VRFARLLRTERTTTALVKMKQWTIITSATLEAGAPDVQPAPAGAARELPSRRAAVVEGRAACSVGAGTAAGAGAGTAAASEAGTAAASEAHRQTRPSWLGPRASEFRQADQQDYPNDRARPAPLSSDLAPSNARTSKHTTRQTLRPRRRRRRPWSTWYLAVVALFSTWLGWRFPVPGGRSTTCAPPCDVRRQI
jgi:hypothetical protein